MKCKGLSKFHSARTIEGIRDQNIGNCADFCMRGFRVRMLRREWGMKPRNVFSRQTLEAKP